MNHDLLRATIKTLRNCFSSWRSWLVMGLVASVIFVVSVLVQNWRFIYEVFFRPETLLYKVYGAIGLQVLYSFKLMGAFSFWSVWALALMFGANMAMVRYLRQQRKGEKIAAKGIVGTVIGILGVGCLACNASILGTALASVGGVGLIALLPFQGQEFLFVGLILGAYSLFSLAKSAELRTCPIRIPPNND